MSHSLEVTPKSSPYLFEIVDKCLSVVDIKLSDITVFIISSPEINAWCGRTKGKVTIGINSALINSIRTKFLLEVNMEITGEVIN